MRRLIALLALLLVAACNISSTVKVSPDGSGSYTVQVLASPKEASGDAIYSQMKQSVRKVRVAAKLTKISEHGLNGAEIRVDFKSLRDLQAISEALSATSGTLGGIKVTRASVGWQ